MIKREKLKDIKKKVNELKPEFNLGKNGVSDTFLDSIKKYLDVHNLVKIKCLIATNKDDVINFANEVSLKTESILIDKKGFTFSLYKK